MTITAVIPARLGSTRLPGKVLADIQGRPLIWHVWNRVRQAEQIAEVFVATDADEVRAAVEGWGGRVVMTSPECRSGTHRIASVLDQFAGEFLLNVQGDEPMIEPAMLDSLVECWRRTRAPLVTPVYRLQTLSQLQDPNLVKVVRAGDGTALYFSRSAVPYVRDVPLEHWMDRHAFWGHVGVYGYAREVLASYDQLPPSGLEETERLEQLRFLEAGLSFQTVETVYHPISVDTPQDLEHVRRIMG